MEKGLIHIYCGSGKGKTTAALGLALRAAGRGKQVLIVRFLKNDDSGEIEALKHVQGITVIPCRKSFGFLFRMDEEKKRQASEWYRSLLEQAIKKAVEEHFDLFILDEAMAACSGGMIDEERLLDFLKNKPEMMEVVLTGRNPSERLLEQADYISEIQAVRHPYEKGVAARRGIEF